MTERLRRLPHRTVFAAGVVLILVAQAFANFLALGGSDEGDDAEVLPFFILSAIAILVLAGMMLRLVPRTESDPDTGNKPARIGLVLAVAALVTVVAFWSTLPIALGLPALILGAEAGSRAPSQGRGAEATATMVIAAVAVVAGFVFCVIG